MLGTRARVLAAAAVLVAATAQPSPAGHHSAVCRFAALSHSTVTGPEGYEGVVVAAIAADPGESVAIRCVGRVNGIARFVTPWESGTTAAGGAARVSFARFITEGMQVCAQTTTSHGFAEVCYPTSTVAVPPQEAQDVSDPAVETLRPAICGALATGAMTAGPVTIAPDGDTYVDSVLVWECAPYDPDKPAPAVTDGDVYLVTS